MIRQAEGDTNGLKAKGNYSYTASKALSRRLALKRSQAEEEVRPFLVLSQCNTNSLTVWVLPTHRPRAFTRSCTSCMPPSDDSFSEHIVTGPTLLLSPYVRCLPRIIVTLFSSLFTANSESVKGSDSGRRLVRTRKTKNAVATHYRRRGDPGRWFVATCKLIVYDQPKLCVLLSPSR